MPRSTVLGKDRVESIVFEDLKKKYPKMEAFEFKSVESREEFNEWWVTGLFSTEGKNRAFFYRLDAETGEIKGYEIIW
jgi:hypothetical protein